MGKHNPARVEIDRATEDPARGQDDLGSTAFGDYLFSNHEPSRIGEDRYHAFLVEVAHCHEKIGVKGAAVCAEARANEAFAHSVMQELADAYVRVGPGFAGERQLTYLGFGGAAHPRD